MLQSMTGFGKATGTYQNKKITVEVKSLNSKNLDLYIRMLPQYKEHEIDLRKYIASQLDRGKIECNINVETNGESKSYSINKEVAGRYYAELVDLGAFLGLPCFPVPVVEPERFDHLHALVYPILSQPDGAWLARKFTLHQSPLLAHPHFRAR